ncbi:hypothetical protein [Flavobacterium tegetincola]|uniref:hypothetical protein n=1 Tax=Flavobacterium tegetincola TaxID=150172 RepID=UPI0004167BC9|nr:hypothetical protein [Flavobacterium tegetincola]
MKKLTLILFSIIISTASVLLFIHFSNDHIECETVSNTVKKSNGETVITERHICKEKYNF